MKHMPINIEGFDHIEYLLVFNTVVFGVVATEFFTGWGNMLRHRENVKVYALHFGWTIFMFLTFIQNWYGIWPRTQFINDNFLFFGYSLVPMIIYHLITEALFPHFKAGEEIDFEQHYFKNSRTLFILLAVYFSITVLSSFVYVDEGNVLNQNLIRVSGFTFSILCAIWNRKIWLHLMFLVLGLAGIGLFIRSILI